MPRPDNTGDHCVSQGPNENFSTTLFQSISASQWEAYSAGGAKSGEAEEPLGEEAEFLLIPDLSPVLKKLSGSIDLDKDSNLSFKELAEAVEDQSITGKDSQALAALYLNRRVVSKLHNDGDSGMSGVSFEDLNALERALPTSAVDLKAIEAAKGWISEEGNFDYADSDRNGFLTVPELNGLLCAPTACEDNSGLWGLSYVKRELERAGNHDGLSEFDVRSMLARGGTFAETIENLADAGQKIIERTYECQQPGISNRLFANSDDPIKSICPEAVRQGSIGNCYFEATLASLSVSNPEAIVRMVTDHGNGIFEVKFPGADFPVMVTAPSETEMGLFNQGSEYGTWACVMEKAFGEYKSLIGNADRSLTMQEGADGGGQPSFAFRILTGVDARDVYSSDPAVVRDVLSTAIVQKKAIATNTPNSGPGEHFTKDGFATRHAFSVIAFDPDGPDGGTITIRNPWAGPDGTPQGAMNISVQQYTEQFVKLTIEGSGGAVF